MLHGALAAVPHINILVPFNVLSVLVQAYHRCKAISVLLAVSYHLIALLEPHCFIYDLADLLMLFQQLLFFVKRLCCSCCYYCSCSVVV